MKRIDEFRTRAGIFLVAASLWLIPAPVRAQNAKLDLSNLEKLSAKATAVSDVSLDGALLQLASASMKLAAKSDPEAGQAMGLIKDIKGIYVRSFTFAEPNQYSQQDVEAIQAQLAAPGWSRVVGNRDKSSGAVSEVYVMKDGGNITGLAVLSAAPKALSVVNIVGPMDLAKLEGLAGNLGIPGNLPVPGGKPLPPPPTPPSAQPPPVPGKSPAGAPSPPSANDKSLGRGSSGSGSSSAGQSAASQAAPPAAPSGALR